MGESSESYWAQPNWIDFLVTFSDQTTRTIRSRGVALDGEDLLFFNHWTESGGTPIGTRVAASRVIEVTTTALPKGAFPWQ